MSALTAEVKDRKSPVAAWLSTTFPDFTEVQKEFRDTAGTQQIHPPAGVVPGTQGAAIDFWLRMLIDPQSSIALPLIGLLTGRAPCIPAGKELLDELAAGIRPRKLPDGEIEWRMRPADFADRGDEWWARLCYALALLVELYRAAMVDNSRLQRLDDRSRGADLLELALDVEVTDLIAMRDLAWQKLVPALPAGPVFSGMTFDGSADLNADADLIAGGVLIDFKAAQGRPPRKDGTRAASLGRNEIDQLLGYTLMDYSDTYKLHSVGVYAVRFGYLAIWPLDSRTSTGSDHHLDGHASGTA